MVLLLRSEGKIPKGFENFFPKGDKGARAEPGAATASKDEAGGGARPSEDDARHKASGGGGGGGGRGKKDGDGGGMPEMPGTPQLVATVVRCLARYTLHPIPYTRTLHPKLESRKPLLQASLARASPRSLFQPQPPSLALSTPTPVPCTLLQGPAPLFAPSFSPRSRALLPLP